MNQEHDQELTTCKEALSRRLLETLHRQLQSNQPASRRQAILRLDNLGPLACQLLPQLEYLLADPDRRVRQAAHETLAILNNNSQNG